MGLTGEFIINQVKMSHTFFKGENRKFTQISHIFFITGS